MSPAPAPPSAWALFLCFTKIGIQSFGGGLSSWMRREVVEQRRWLADAPFLSGFALSQIAPGPNAVNLAIFIGATLRGPAGAMAALGGLMLLPGLLILGVGALYFSGRQLPLVEAGLSGVGCAAIALNFANGIRLGRRNIVGLRHIVIILALVVAIGWLHLPLLPVLGITISASLLFERLARR